MTSFQCANIQGDFDPTQINEPNDDSDSTIDEKKDSADTEKTDGEFHLAQETCEGTPRSNRSKSSSVEASSSSIPKKLHGHRPISGRTLTPKSPHRHNIQPLSSIPLPVKTSGPIKVPPLLKNVRSSSRTNSIVAIRTPNIANKHTLEIQFINKNKRYIQMKREMVEKQRPVLDLYQGLVQIKKKLEELGKTVKLEDIKLLTYEEYKKPMDMHGAGEQVSMEVVAGMKHSIEEIPKTLMDICKNLLSRRALIVELLESVTKSEVDVSEVSDKIESLKNEGQQLQHSLDAVINEHEFKINILVGNWQKLLNDKQSCNADNKIEELEGKLEHQERLTLESNNIIHELYSKMEERKSAYDRAMNEFTGVIQSLQEQKNKLEQELETEKKTTVDFKSRNSTNSQNLKTMRSKITELENEKSTVETSNAEMQKKIRLLQDQIKHKEASWSREREELTKSLKHQENLLQKLTAEKNQFETRFKSFENAKRSTELKLQSTINSLNDKLNITNNQLEDIRSERNEALKKCTEFENYIAKMRIECKETMSKVSYSIEWGKDVSTPAAENYIHEIAKDLRIRELQDRIHDLENEKVEYVDKGQERQENVENEPGTKAFLPLLSPGNITSYQLLLRESENKLQEKLNDLRSTEIENLRSEIRQLKVRQVALEEQNTRCPTSELQQMVEQGQRKLHELMKRSMESEHTVEKYVNVIEKQTYQINEMENLLRYREKMANVLKSSRDELLQEKESLINYSQEIKKMLVKVTKQGKVKEGLARELEEKVYLRERQIAELKESVEQLEANLLIKNEKRFKLHEKIGSLQNQFEDKKGHHTPLLQKEKSQLQSSDFLIPQYNSNDCNNVLPIPSPNSQRQVHFAKNSCCKKYSSRECNNVLSHPKLRKTSNHKMDNIQFSIISDRNSDHSSCQHKANSRSLISLSLQTVDFLKTRLNFLTSVNMLPENTDRGNEPGNIDSQLTNSIQTTRHKKLSQENVGKILKLSAKRYKYLQKQTNESYEDLTKLVKFAVSHQGGYKK